MSVKPISTLVGNMEKQANPSGLPFSLDSSPEVGRHGVFYDILRLPTSPKELGDTPEKPFSSMQTADHLSSPGDGDGSSGPDAVVASSSQQDEIVPSGGEDTEGEGAQLKTNEVTDQVHHLLSDRVLDPLVKPLVDRVMMDYMSTTTSSPGSSARGMQGSELVVEGNLELPYDLAERIMKDVFLQLLGILLPLSGQVAETSEGHGREMAANIIATEAIRRESANTRDSAVEDGTKSTTKNDIPVDRDDLPSVNRFSGVSNFFRRTFSKWRKKTSKVGPALSKKVQT